jgi:adenylosuccinate synthase
MVTSIIVGCGFGDEGKGTTTNHLVRQAYAAGENPMVVRFSGGPQAGHHVLLGDTSHTFHHYGSGSLLGAPTFWSKYCYTEPGAICHEYSELVRLGLYPGLYIDPMSPVITPYDRLANQRDHDNIAHGTCGQGIGFAAKRTEESPHKLYAKDLFAPKWVLEERLKSVRSYYGNPTSLELYKEVEAFMAYSRHVPEIALLATESSIVEDIDHLIFEGSQGILLDRDHGFFPHVTRASTTSKNAKEMIERNGWDTPTVHYVTRPYLTRHGAGPMGPGGPVQLNSTRGEINVTNPWQGEFRVSIFDRGLFNYAVSCDPYSHLDYYVVVTGLDRVKDTMTYRNTLGDVVTTDTYLFVKSLSDKCLISENYEFKYV